MGTPEMDACQTSTVRRKMAEESMDADSTGQGEGRVTGKHWWTGVEAGQRDHWDMSLLIPVSIVLIWNWVRADVTDWSPHHPPNSPDRGHVYLEGYSQRIYIHRFTRQPNQLPLNRPTSHARRWCPQPCLAGFSSQCRGHSTSTSSLSADSNGIRHES
jgi:hypothetical protein